MRGAGLAILLGAGCLSRLGSAQSLCQSCEVQLGIGTTYHFWGATDGLVLPATLDWSEGRYELGLFRLGTRQILYDAHYRYGRLMANPYWGMSLSRRWRLFDRGPVSGFVGFGVAAKTESDQLSVTRLDFASQLGVRFPLPGNQVVGELAFRHWSNGGIRLPNHGQDFVTLTVRLTRGLFGLDRTERITVGGLADAMRQLSANGADAANLP